MTAVSKGPLKLLLGGSPCTHWSIARTKNRETEPSGVGWDLFLNYRIARDRFRPDFFLYENNKSISPAIRAQITKELGVEPVLINSALVSAQSRQRLYWAGRRGPDGTYSQVPVEQPEDRGILLRDIVFDAKGIPAKFWYDRTYTMTGNISGVVAIMDAPHWLDVMKRVYSLDTKSPTLNTVGAGNLQAKVLQEGRARKLMPREYARLQTVPDRYIFPVSDTQAYKMLGNGWTVDVIAHILSHFEGITKRPLDVFSMYDGMSCGHLALDKLGANVARYHATEIDRYAIQTAQTNYPDIVQLGDAFQVREPAPIAANLFHLMFANNVSAKVAFVAQQAK